MSSRRAAAPGPEPVLALDDPPCRVRLSVSPRARRLTLRLAPQSGAPALTLPPGVTEAEARQFLLRHRDWLARALARQPAPTPVAPGVRLPVAGRTVTLEAAPGPRRAPVLEGDRLILAGPGAAGPRVAAWLKARARAAIAPLAERHAARLERPIAAIRFGDTRSRWGSCSSAGRLGFSWRLAMTPPEVQAYVAAHEAAHLVELNHSPRYWALLASLMPDYAGPRGWLKREGRALHRFAFTAPAVEAAADAGAEPPEPS